MELEENEKADKYAVTISKEEVAELQAEEYIKDIILIDCIEDVKAAVSKLSKQIRIGFDTETKPSFKRGHINYVSLLQLSTPNECFLFRLNRIGLPDDLKGILENPNIQKIGLSTHDDFNSLRKLCDVNPDGFIELQSFVKNYKIIDCSLTKIYAILFGLRISKGQRLTNWEADELSQHQQCYAALDAEACVRIYEHLISGKFIPEESKYYRKIESQQINTAVTDNSANIVKSVKRNRIQEESGSQTLEIGRNTRTSLNIRGKNKTSRTLPFPDKKSIRKPIQKQKKRNSSKT